MDLNFLNVRVIECCRGFFTTLFKNREKVLATRLDRANTRSAKKFRDKELAVEYVKVGSRTGELWWKKKGKRMSPPNARSVRGGTNTYNFNVKS